MVKIKFIKECKNCGLTYSTYKNDAKYDYCCTCRKYHKNCEVCGKEIFVQARSCSKECAYELRKASWLKSCGTIHNMCKNSTSRIKWQKEMLESEGITNIFQRDTIKEKIKKTFKERYGFEYLSQSLEIQKERIKHSLEKWVSERPNQSKIYRDSQEKLGLWIPLSELSKKRILLL